MTASISFPNGLMDFLYPSAYQSDPFLPQRERILHESLPGCHFHIANR